MKTFFILMSVFVLWAPPAHAQTNVINSIVINGGAESTDSIFVGVQLEAPQAQFVRFASKANMNNATPYEIYTSGKSYQQTLSPGTGLRYVCAQVKDTSGNQSEPVCDGITMNMYGYNYPTGLSVRINDDAQNTANRAVQLILTANQAGYVAISNSPNFSDAQWTPYSRVQQWMLPGDEGHKEVYVLFASETGTIAQYISDSIQYKPGTGSPIGQIVIENGAVETDSIDVLIKTRNVSGADTVRFGSNTDMDHATAFESIKEYIPVTLSPGYGQKTLCAQFRNDRTQEVSPLDCDTIILRTKGEAAPTQTSIKIDDGAQETLVHNVQLSLQAHNATRMAVSNYADFKQVNWQPYKEKIMWTLLSGGGEKTVYVLFASQQGHITEVETQEITVTGAQTNIPQNGQTQPPTPIITSPPSSLRVPKKLPNGVKHGMLVKRFDRPDVYYIGRDGYRYVFPNQNIFLSWFTSDDLRLTNKGGKVVTLDNTTLAAIPIGGNITYRPGAYLVKIPSDPRVYAVDSYGQLRWVTNASVAAQLYGLYWSKDVRDLEEAYFADYYIGNYINSEADFNVVQIKAQHRSIDDNKQLQGN